MCNNNYLCWASEFEHFISIKHAGDCSYLFLNTFLGKHAQHDTPLASSLSIYKYIHIQPPQSPIIRIYFAETQVPVLADTCRYVWWKKSNYLVLSFNMWMTWLLCLRTRKSWICLCWLPPYEIFRFLSTLLAVPSLWSQSPSTRHKDLSVTESRMVMRLSISADTMKKAIPLS